MTFSAYAENVNFFRFKGMEKKLSVIIVNYRSGQYLNGCLASLHKYLKNVNFEIIIVNNDEKESLEGIKKVYPEIKLINHQKNIGFGAGNNLGVREAGGEIILFLNPDTEILAQNIDDILRRFRKDKKIAVVGPRLVTEKGETQWWCAGKEITFLQIIKNNIGIIECKKIWESREETFCDWISGAAFFIKKDVFENTGGFDEKFFMYFEEVDLCLRVKKINRKILYYPKVSILHKGGKSWKSFWKQKKEFFKSFGRYTKKNWRYM